MVSQAIELIGKTLDGYQISAQIGRGATALVFKAQHPDQAEPVALNVLRPHQAEFDNFAERFKRESRVLAQLDHPHLLPIIDYGQDAAYSYIATKYIAGGTLKQKLAGGRPSETTLQAKQLLEKMQADIPEC